MSQDQMNEGTFRLTIYERLESEPMYGKHYPIQCQTMCTKLNLKEEEDLPIIIGQGGMQQLGKSTFANKMMGTKFQTGNMDAQTTLGLNIRKGALEIQSQIIDVLVSDNEGYDSGEDGDQSLHISINNSTILMAYSDIVLFHMDIQEISQNLNYKYLLQFIEKYLSFFSEDKETENFKIKPLTIVICFRDVPKALFLSQECQDMKQIQKKREVREALFHNNLAKETQNTQIQDNLERISFQKMNNIRDFINFEFMFVQQLTYEVRAGEFKDLHPIQEEQKVHFSKIIAKVQQELKTSGRPRLSIGNCFQTVNLLIETLNLSENKNLSFAEILQECAMIQIQNSVKETSGAVLINLQGTFETLQYDFNLSANYEQENQRFKNKKIEFENQNSLKISQFLKNCVQNIKCIIDKFQVSVSKVNQGRIDNLIFESLEILNQAKIKEEMSYLKKVETSFNLQKKDIYVKLQEAQKLKTQKEAQRLAQIAEKQRQDQIRATQEANRIAEQKRAAEAQRVKQQNITAANNAYYAKVEAERVQTQRIADEKKKQLEKQEEERKKRLAAIQHEINNPRVEVHKKKKRVCLLI